MNKQLGEFDNNNATSEYDKGIIKMKEKTVEMKNSSFLCMCEFTVRRTAGLARSLGRSQNADYILFTFHSQAVYTKNKSMNEKKKRKKHKMFLWNTTESFDSLA